MLVILILAWMNIDESYAMDVQLPLTLVLFVLLTLIFPVAAWFCLIAISHGVELVTGYDAPLVGKNRCIDLVAVLVAICYLALYALIASGLVKRGCI
jgi:heme/copper-type cytochrome/quinol oxidase subunit 2